MNQIGVSSEQKFKEAFAAYTLIPGQFSNVGQQGEKKQNIVLGQLIL